MDRGDNFVSIGCVAKSPKGEFRITDWRGGGGTQWSGGASVSATAPLVFRLQGDQDMLNFQVGHEVEISGPIIEDANGTRPAGMKVESILYLSRTCWKRGTNRQKNPAKPTTIDKGGLSNARSAGNMP